MFATLISCLKAAYLLFLQPLNLIHVCYADLSDDYYY